jgi:hypothetical protein
MKHLTEEEMIAEVYGEGRNSAAVERHLEHCADCLQAFAELKRDLGDLEHVEAPARDEAYGERVWAAIAPLLPVYAREKRHWWESGWSTNRWMKGLGYAAAGVLLVASAFYAGRIFEQREQRKQPPIANQQQQTPQARQPIVVVVLDEHLDRSERFLVQLKHADVDSAQMVSPLRDEARNLLAANRVCRKNLAQTDDPELATALDHLDSLLAEAANEPGGLNAQAIAHLQDEMNGDGLLFEVRVLRSRISDRKAAGGDGAKGGTI